MEESDLSSSFRVLVKSKTTVVDVVVWLFSCEELIDIRFLHLYARFFLKSAMVGVSD